MSTDRIKRLKQAVQTAKPGVCTERALIWTQYFRNRRNRSKNIFIQMAEALREVLLKKSIVIYPDELVVGNFSSKRVGGSIYPELHGVVVMQDLFNFSRRRTNPLEISNKEILQLLKIIPFWLFRFLGIKAHASKIRTLRFLIDQLNARYYFINESGGIAHLAPNYEKLLKRGTQGIVAEVNALQEKAQERSDSWYFLESIKIIADGLSAFGRRYAALASRMAKQETDPVRKQELSYIAAACRNVPLKGAATFHQALQSLFFAQIAINLESLDNAICPGRMDQYLFPYYERDLASGLLTRKMAKELVAAFSIKMSEIVPIFSKLITCFHGGMFNGQVVTVGGVDEAGADAVNELSYIFLEVMDELRMRQPNYHARLHADSPRPYLHKIFEILAAGSNSPALYNDDVIVPTMVKNGYTIADARNYTAVGCVEPVCQGKSFASTDAALFNMPIMLELTLNEGRRFGTRHRSGLKTKSVSQMKSMADVREAFEAQLRFGIEKLLSDLQAIEKANARYHPTPLTSMLLDGCFETATCSTRGGAVYNFSGIQCVGPADTGDSLYAIEQAVFREGKLTLPELLEILKHNFPDHTWQAYLRNLGKFGNDDESADRYTQYVVQLFTDLLAGRKNTRGGYYTTGIYSVTAHQYFGQVTGALPSGREKGESFASGIAPSNGLDRLGPTAMLNSVNRIDVSRCANGVNLNVKFDAASLRGKTGRNALQSLCKTYFRRGGMQVQTNVLDPSMLIAARQNPEAYPNLLVRVSGYSAYFNDLTLEMKDEIIRRTFVQMGMSVERGAELPGLSSP
ncbi:MAG: formate acetyltransferase [Deltaproteobacteria bacterium]|nr:formate acetyltransferase [Deltaproteobacteria bacterium]